MLPDAQQAIPSDRANRNGIQAPLAENLEDLVFPALRGHQQHALLRFREHDFVRRHAGFALRHQVQFDLDARAPAAAHLAGRAREPRRAHVLYGDNRARLHGFQARLQQQLLQEWIAHLHVGPLLLGFFGELGRRHGRAVDAVAARLGAHVNHGVADARGARVEDVFLLRHPQREDIHQRIPVVASLKNALAAQRRHAEAVAVMRDARHHALEDTAVARAVLRIVQWAEAQRIEHRDGPRAHGENVAQNAAHSRSRALKRLDKAGVVVRFDLERDHIAAAHIDDARVLAGTLHYQLAAGGQLLQVQARALVGAVLAPHHAEHAQFGIARLAAQNLHDLAVFRSSELVLSDQIGSHGHGAHSWSAAGSPAIAMLRKTTRPSLDPISGSVARSGCGIIPITLRRAFRIPAMSRMEPLGLST